MHVQRLKIVVVGAGSIGCHLGGHLAQEADVTLVGRPRITEAITAEGLTLTDLGGRTTHVGSCSIRVATEPSRVAEADVVLLTTKSGATAAAVAEMAPHLHQDSLIVSFQNGLANVDAAEGALGELFPSGAARPLVLVGMVPYNVVQTGPATFEQATSGRLLVADHPRVDRLVHVAHRSGLDIGVHQDMRSVMQAKLLMNLNNALNALSGLPLRDQLMDRDSRHVLASCQEEALAVYRAAGVHPARITALPPIATPHVLRAPNPVFGVLARRTLQVAPAARSSMSDDLDQGRPTEIDNLQGAVISLGEKFGVPTPACRQIVSLVHEAEHAGPSRRRWTGRELRNAVRV
ncbi:MULTISPECIES: 2-dehydropantoate 2-reductase [unclassified Janibacter]|uniref:2-dehydropantoate 2-reductase n=1 Tax=unclassified Janibacter TaxID=2649294 RepID=UPI003CFCE242